MNSTMKLNTSHGVLTNEGIFHKWDTHYATLEIENVSHLSGEGLMYAALQGRFTHLWIHPSTGIRFTPEQVEALLDTQRWDVGPEGKLISVQKNGTWKGYVASITGRALKPRPTWNTRLIFIEQGNWPLDNATPEQILSVADKVESTLGVAMAGSPTSVGLRFLEVKNKRYYEHYFEKSEKIEGASEDEEMDWEGLKELNIPFFAWFPSTESQVGMYLHCADRNASHPYAASQENMGVGTPFMQEGGEFNKKYPGLWNVEISLQYPLTGHNLLPSLFPGGQ